MKVQHKAQLIDFLAWFDAQPIEAVICTQKELLNKYSSYLSNDTHVEWVIK